MKLNVRLLRRIKRHILEEPRRFFMSGTILKIKNKAEWDREQQYSVDLAPTRPPCGTVACIAGWAYILDKKYPKSILDNRLAVAATILGLAWNHAQGVFLSNLWPEPYYSQFKNAKTPRERARVAAARIEHLIKKGN